MKKEDCSDSAVADRGTVFEDLNDSVVTEFDRQAIADFMAGERELEFSSSPFICPLDQSPVLTFTGKVYHLMLKCFTFSIFLDTSNLQDDFFNDLPSSPDIFQYVPDESVLIEFEESDSR